MENFNLITELSFERNRWVLPDYECIIVTDSDSWREVIDYVGQWCYCNVNVQRKLIRTSETGVVRFLDVNGLTCKVLQDFSCGSQNSTIILDLERNYDKYLGGSDGLNYLRSRMRSVADCHTRFVVI